MSKITYYKLCTDTKGKDININDVFDIIKSDQIKTHTNYLRNESDKKLRRFYKQKNLPAVTFAGIFTYRQKQFLTKKETDRLNAEEKEKNIVRMQNNQKPKIHYEGGLIKSSGLMCFDYDESIEEKNIDILKNDKYVYAMFRSPSDYRKFLVKIPEVKTDEEYKEYYLSAMAYFKGKGIFLDSTQDICRLCYLTHDKDIYINQESEKYTERKLPVESFTEKKTSAPIKTNKFIEPSNSIPRDCQLIEKVLTQSYIKSGSGVSKHSFVDPHVYNYCTKNKKDIQLQQFKQHQGRQDSAFNEAEKVEFNCGSLINFANKSGLKESVKERCHKCQLYKKYVKTIKKNIDLPHDGRLISEFAKDIAVIVKDKKELFFKTDVMTIVKVEQIVEKEGTTIGFKEMNATQLVSYIEKYCDTGLFKNTAKNKEEPCYDFTKKSLSKSHADITLNAEQFYKELPIIKTIYNVPMPILHEGKIVFPCKKYDERFNSWLEHDSPVVEEEISLEKAKKIINDLFSEFCFTAEIDKVHAIAGFITPYIRGLYKYPYARTPIFLYEGNRERAGKDYCAGITGIVYYGEAREEPPISTDDNSKTASGEELRKKLTGALKQGKKHLHFSNNRGFLSNAVLESFVTNSFWSDRLLGKNQEIEMGNNTEITLSANIGLTYTADLSYRMRKIRLFLEDEDPNKRKFKKIDLHGYVRENREEILGALQTIVKDWADNGMKKSKTLFSSFPEWAGICGGIMKHIGFGDPCLPDKDENIVGGDTMTQDFKILFQIMHDHHPNKWISKSDLYHVVNQLKEEYEIFMYLDLNVPNDKVKFGKRLTLMFGRILGEIKLKVDQSSNRASRYRLMFYKEIGRVGRVGRQFDPSAIKNKKKVSSSGNRTSPTNPTNPTTSSTLVEQIMTKIGKNPFSLQQVITDLAKKNKISEFEIEKKITILCEKGDLYKPDNKTIRRFE